MLTIVCQVLLNSIYVTQESLLSVVYNYSSLNYGYVKICFFFFLNQIMR